MLNRGVRGLDGSGEMRGVRQVRGLCVMRRARRWMCKKDLVTSFAIERRVR